MLSRMTKTQLRSSVVGVTDDLFNALQSARASLKLLRTNVRTICVSGIDEAARKGTREKARAKKVKVEVKKVGFIPHNQRKKDKLTVQINKHVDDSWKAIPKDDVYVGRYYRWKVYTVQEAIQGHREHHHETMCNNPNAPLNVEIELNMQAEKSTKFVDNFQRIIMVPHEFEQEDTRNILVFTKDEVLVREARNAGAALAGGVELIKDITNGDIQLSDYHYVLAHPNILPELVALRGLLRKKFPNPKSGTIGNNLEEMVRKFKNGINCKAVKDENQQNFGLISLCIGTIDMPIPNLEDNLIAVLKDIDSVRPKREGKFITRVLLKSPPSSEQFKIDPFVYIAEERATKGSKKVESQDEPEDVKQEAVN